MAIEIVPDVMTDGAGLAGGAAGGDELDCLGIRSVRRNGIVINRHSV